MRFGAVTDVSTWVYFFCNSLGSMVLFCNVFRLKCRVVVGDAQFALND